MLGDNSLSFAKPHTYAKKVQSCLCNHRKSGFFRLQFLIQKMLKILLFEIDFELIQIANNFAVKLKKKKT